MDCLYVSSFPVSDHAVFSSLSILLYSVLSFCERYVLHMKTEVQMPYPMFKSSSTPKPAISRPLPLRSYQDQDHESSRWSKSHTSEYPSENYPRPNFWPARLPTIPPRSPLRSRIDRPNVPPALTRNFHAPRHDADLNYYFDELIHTPTSSSSSSSSFRSFTPSPSSASPTHTTFASADPSFNKWLAMTIGHQRYITGQRLVSATTSDTTRSTVPDFPSPPVSRKDGNVDGLDQVRAYPHTRSGSDHGYADYPQLTTSLMPPPSSLSLCNSSGWSCIARRAARTS